MAVVDVGVIKYGDEYHTTWLLKEEDKDNILYCITIEIARFVESKKAS